MADNLADRLKHLAEQNAAGKQAEQDQRAFQERINDYISNNARTEYDKLVRLLRERAEQMNLMIENLPKFVPGGYFVQQANMALYFHFDKPIMNRPENMLVLSVGAAPNTMYLDGPPEPVRYRLQAAAADDFSRIVWTGDLGEITSEKLVDVALEQLTTYYLEHKTGS